MSAWFAKWTVITDLQLNQTREYNLHCEMFLVWVLMVGALGNSFTLALSLLARVGL